jgi:transcriptional regulator with XRE-family HTH domain
LNNPVQELNVGKLGRCSAAAEHHHGAAFDGRTTVTDAGQDVTDKAFARILGQEIRRAREGRGWSRVQLVERLPSGIGDRTLLSYEQGLRQLSVTRFVEISRALGVAASDLLARALEKARDLRAFSMRVNLRAVLRDQQDEFESVRRWARNRIKSDPDSLVILLAPSTIRELAVALDHTHHSLAAYLAEFTTQDLPAE